MNKIIILLILSIAVVIGGFLYFFFSAAHKPENASPTISTQQKVKQVKQSLEKEIPSLKQEAAQEIAKSHIPNSQNPLQLTKVVATPEEKQLIPDEVGEIFNQFDFNNDGLISIDEAASFYYWVGKNIQYRYDDENETNPLPNTLVGDGRSGSDYRQTPLETLSEGAGDCEDMATLEVAFYNYWGIPAYVAAVNADDPKYVDHAVAAVKIDSSSLDDFRNRLGDLMYWEFKPGEEIQTSHIETIPEGFYMLIDNSYSNDFGYLTNGLQEGKFNIFALASLESPYDSEWNEFVEASSSEWTR